MKVTITSESDDGSKQLTVIHDGSQHVVQISSAAVGTVTYSMDKSIWNEIFKPL